MRRTSLLILMLLLGCAKRAYESAPTADYGYDRNMYSYEAAEDAEVTVAQGRAMSKSAAGYGAPAAPPPPPAPIMDSSAATAPSGGEAQAEAPADSPAEARMVHYDGYLQMMVVEPEKVLDTIAAKARQEGGKVESLGTNRVTIQVPVDRFQAIYKELQSLGEVLEKSLSAQDVTDAYTSTDLRLKTATATRDRLVQLLAQAKTEKEKIAILKEIQRVTEEIDLLEAQLTTLGQLAEFSRITVELVPRPAFATQAQEQDLAGMGWIQDLSPFRRDVGAWGKLLKLPVPDGMVALDQRKHLVAEGPDGAAFWTGRHLNNPEGDTTFWIEAIEQRLGPSFSAVEQLTVGEFTVLRFVEANLPDGYRYFVGVRAEGRHLDIVEVYLPNPAAEERYGAAVKAAIAGGQG